MGLQDNVVLQGLLSFQNSVQQLAQTRAINQARETVDQIHNSELDEEEKLQAFRQLGRQFAFQAAASGMPFEQAKGLAEAIAPKPQLYQTAEQAALNAEPGSRAQKLGMELHEGDLKNKRDIEAMQQSGANYRAELIAGRPRPGDAARQEAQIRDVRNFVEKSEGYKNYSKALEAKNEIEKAVLNPSGYGDLTAMFAFMRALDPTSVVREGEQTLFRATGSLSDRAAAALNKVVNGKSLDADQRAEVQQVIGQLAESKRTTYDRVWKRAQARAQRLGIPREEVDPFYDQTSAPTPAAGASASASAAVPAAAPASMPAGQPGGLRRYLVR